MSPSSSRTFTVLARSALTEVFYSRLLCNHRSRIFTPLHPGSDTTASRQGTRSCPSFSPDEE